MNATGKRFQRRIEMVYFVGLVYLNRVVEERASPNASTKKSKVPIRELILHQRTRDNKPIFLLATKKFNLVGYKVCYIKLYAKQRMDFGDCPEGHLVHSFPEVKDEISKTFSPFAVEASQGAVLDE